MARGTSHEGLDLCLSWKLSFVQQHPGQMSGLAIHAEVLRRSWLACVGAGYDLVVILLLPLSAAWHASDLVPIPYQLKQ